MSKTQQMATYILKNNRKGDRAKDILESFNKYYNENFSVSDVHNAFRLIDKGFAVAIEPSQRKAKRNERKDSSWLEYANMVAKDVRRFTPTEKEQIRGVLNHVLTE